MVTIPSFSLPKTRQEFDNTRIFLTKFYQTNEGLSLNDASRIASQVINFKTQGLTQSQINKALEQDSAFRVEKKNEQEARLEKLKNTEKEKLKQKKIEEAKKRSAERKKSRTSKERTPDEVRELIASQKSEPLVSNPNNPRGALIPKSQADEILKKRIEQGKNTRVNSLAQKNNPSIIDKIRESLKSKPNDNSKAEVVAVNKSLVLLSNGKSVPRNEFTGIIPEKFLITARSKAPENNVTDIKDLERNKAIITNPSLTKVQSPIKTDNTASNIEDASKTTRTKRPSKSVFQNDKPETTPIGDTIETITDSIGNFVDSITNTTPEAKGETGKETTPLDPLKSVTDFFGSIFNSKTESTEETPKETTPTKETPKETETNVPTPEEQPETPLIEQSKIKKITEFASKNSFAIAGTAISLISLLAFLSVPREVRTEISRMN